jgi:hypothetical protein
MSKAQVMLDNLRTLRLEQQERADRAADLFAMATRGMSTRRATDTGGTGDCPLSRYAGDYAVAKGAAQRKALQADDIWRRVEPLLRDVELEAGSLIALYYNHALDWEDMRSQIKRSDAACQRMHREMVQRLDGLL